MFSRCGRTGRRNYPPRDQLYIKVSKQQQIEFPSILLPPDISSGSIVDINVARNFDSEHIAGQKFAALQSEIYNTFGQDSPTAPVLRCRNATQTSIVLEWDPVNLATAELRSLSLYRNGSKAGNIPRDKLSTKISGLAIDTEYTFHLILRTSAGTYTSEKLVVRTQKMTDLTGITITPGVMPAQLREQLAITVERIGAKLIDTVRIDTTHFVCTEGRGQAWEKAVEMNVPVVVPDWVKGCEREGRIVGVRGYYLNADPKMRTVGPGANQSQTTLSSQQSAPQNQQSNDRRPNDIRRESQLRVNPPLTSPRIEHTPPTPEQTRAPPVNGSEPPTPPPKNAKKTDTPEQDSTPEAALEAVPEATPEVAAEPASAPAAQKAIDENAESSTNPDPEPVPEPVPAPAPAAPAEVEPRQDQVQEEEQEQEENNLKAIGIPHDDAPSPRTIPSKAEGEGEGEAGFDDVSL